ncbi:MAG: hypothetical protein Kow0069_15090 [Promethearchaeota archaeon]
MAAPLREGHDESNVTMVKIVRSKFSNQGPFNEKGESFSVYVRRLG